MCFAPTYLVESLFLVGGDGAIRGRVRHAGEHEALTHLVVVEEGLVGLVDGPGLDGPGAGGAGPGAARVREVDASLLRGGGGVGGGRWGRWGGKGKARNKCAHPSGVEMF